MIVVCLLNACICNAIPNWIILRCWCAQQPTSTATRVVHCVVELLLSLAGCSAACSFCYLLTFALSNFVHISDVFVFFIEPSAKYEHASHKKLILAMIFKVCKMTMQPIQKRVINFIPHYSLWLMSTSNKESVDLLLCSIELTSVLQAYNTYRLIQAISTVCTVLQTARQRYLLCHDHETVRVHTITPKTVFQPRINRS